MHLGRPLISVLRDMDATVLGVLSHTSRPMTATDIVRIAGTGTRRGAALALERLHSQGLVIPHHTGRIIAYAMNRDHILLPALEAFIAAAEDALPTLRRELSDIARSSLPSDATLAMYGSAARGDGTDASDIDLVLAASPEHDPEALDDACEQIEAHIVERTGNPAHIYRLNVEDIAYKISHADPMIASWRTDAHTLHGPDFRQLLAPKTEAA